MTKKSSNAPTPTQEQFAALNGAYVYFNKALFGNQLPGCILNFSRLHGTHGFMAPERWKRQGEKNFGTHEISLTPTTLYRTPVLIFSTLVHEMAHLWQWEFGNPSRNGYHNREWAAKMKEIGLIPSNTGQPGGMETGQNMTHYIEKDGKYEKAFEKMPDKYLLPFTALDGEVMKRLIEGTDEGGGGDEETKRRVERLKKLRPPAKNKTKYTCPVCKASVWGRPGLLLHHKDCEADFEEIE